MPIKRARSLIPLAFYLAVTVVVVWCDMATNEELAKNFKTLSECVKTIQDKMVTLERGATHSGADPLQSGPGTQHSSTDPAGLSPPPRKKTRLEDEVVISNEETEDTDVSQGPLVMLSEAAAAFLETAFSMKLDNNAQKVKANGIPDLRWIQCAKLDSVVSANVLTAAKTADRASSCIQNF